MRKVLIVQAILATLGLGGVARADFIYNLVNQQAGSFVATGTITTDETVGPNVGPAIVIDYDITITDLGGGVGPLVLNSANSTLTGAEWNVDASSMSVTSSSFASTIFIELDATLGSVDDIYYRDGFGALDLRISGNQQITFFAGPFAARAVPEPSGLGLCALGGVGLVGIRLRRRKAQLASAA